MHRFSRSLFMLVLGATTTASVADENLFGYIKGAEPLPKGALEFYQQLTQRSDKGQGHYQALDTRTELEYGISDRLAGSLELNGLAIDTEGLIINGYLPQEKNSGWRPSGVEGSLKYNFLSPAKDDIGVSTLFSISYSWLDPHSGQDKDTLSIEQKLLLQKYYLDGQLIVAGNLGYEATRAKRAPISDLPADYEWPTTAEMEIELNIGAGISYRFAPNWFLGVETLYAEEHETEVDLERWSWQGGPTLHYGANTWWATLSWLPQLRGGGEKYDGQTDQHLHLIEKTKQEVRFKIGYNF